MTSVSRLLLCEGVDGDGTCRGRGFLPSSTQPKAGKCDLSRCDRKEITDRSLYIRRRSAVPKGLPKRREQIKLGRKRPRLQNKTNKASKKMEDSQLQCSGASVSSLQDANKNVELPVEPSGPSGQSQQPADVSEEFIFGISPEENEFLSPDLEPSVTNKSVVVKEEPGNAKDDICDGGGCNAEPYHLKNETDIVGTARVSHDGCPAIYCDSDGACNNDSPFLVGSIHPNDISTIEGCSTGLISIKETNDLVSNNNSIPTNGLDSTNGIVFKNDSVPTSDVSTNEGTCVNGANLENTVLLNPQVQLPIGGVQFADLGSINQILTFVTTPSLRLMSSTGVTVQQPEEEGEVQVEVSNKWHESRGDSYVNLSILSGFPNPKVTRSISLTKEGIQIFIHNLALKNKHSVWDALGCRANIETGQSLSILANHVEKMKICSGCRDQNCRALWDENTFRQKGFIEYEFSRLPVYRSFLCNLLLDCDTASRTCVMCQADWDFMVIVNGWRKKESNRRRVPGRVNILRSCRR